jgi:isopenicillin N synthase-like dioxygenase
VSFHVPVIDLSLPREELLAQLRKACEEWGFFQVVGHGVDLYQCQQALDVTREFFQLESAEKLFFERDAESPWGFYDRELTKNLRDRKEIFDFSLGEEVLWPESMPEFRRSLDSYTQQIHQFSLQLLQLLAESYSRQTQTLTQCFNNEHSSFTRLNYYPNCFSDCAAEAAEDETDLADLGISEHTDAGGLTVLLQDSTAGLQMQLDGDWQTIEPVSGAFTINVGDMLQVWSNDGYSAPLHRVLASDERERYSIAYFLNPSYDAVIAPLDKPPLYQPVPWREFRELRAQGDYGDYGEEVQISQYRINQ